ncbi:efflux RND transporter periplasmic adaptor subunit [Methylotuvimicrobium sp. KM2]|uniref:efflux RND transporter periplasmic adaptor subunit n=1 Tax=Methylotuvimicrobium sp. KM2 TaxID=3133976 RepID=UPI003100D933
MTTAVPKKIRPKEILRQRNRRLKGITLAILLAGLSYFAYWWYVNRDWVTTDDAFVAGHLITIKALTEGIVVEVAVEDTQSVQAGDLLIRLDGNHAEVALQQAKAELAETVRNIVTLKTRIETLNHRVIARQASLATVRHDLKRYESALFEGAVSEQQVQNARDQLRELEAAIGEAEAEKMGIQAQLLESDIDHHPSVEKAKSRVKKAYLDYRRSNIFAPVSGYVANRRAHVGDHIKSGMPLMAIVPLDEVWVEANFLETQIASIRPGQSAEIKIDAYGGERLYHGTVQGLNPGTGSVFAVLPTNNATGNFIHIAERVPVRIGLDPKEIQEHPLQPGLSTLTRINISETGEPLLTSNAGTRTEFYRTTIFDNELEEAERLIHEIIFKNQPANYRLKE